MQLGTCFFLGREEPVPEKRAHGFAIAERSASCHPRCPRLKKLFFFFSTIKNDTKPEIVAV
jgi:hypothetical protein